MINELPGASQRKVCAQEHVELGAQGRLGSSANLIPSYRKVLN